MGSKEPINLERERNIRETARLLEGVGVDNAGAISRVLQESAERFYETRPRRRQTIAEQWATGLAEGEREGSF